MERKFTTVEMIDDLLRMTAKEDVHVKSVKTYHSIRFSKPYPQLICTWVNRCLFVFNMYYIGIDDRKFFVGRSEYLEVRNKIKSLL